jgi:hypothetical protein
VKLQVIGYMQHGNKFYVAFREADDSPEKFKITDGFHDRSVAAENRNKYKGYEWVGKNIEELKRIISRMRGSRPWHPLLKELRKEDVR